MSKCREIVRRKYCHEPGLPDNLRGFGMYYADKIDMVFNCAMAKELYNEWPEQGGYFEQDVKLVSDMFIITELMRFIERTEFAKRNDGG